MNVEVEMQDENVDAAKAALHDFSSQPPTARPSKAAGHTVLLYTSLEEEKRQQFADAARGVGLRPRFF